ncbi:hypothetical protein GCM10009593_26840 [Microlunatus antarcticus]|uniref:Uncharacterized protein n=1 Tax=Microlunatus antarcticus TaxID=53388 RepID=A0A7W5P719_9ACTN|nr:hypothetical protein [Microlunatus antarcticus]
MPLALPAPRLIGPGSEVQHVDPGRGRMLLEIPMLRLARLPGTGADAERLADAVDLFAGSRRS